MSARIIGIVSAAAKVGQDLVDGGLGELDTGDEGAEGFGWLAFENNHVDKMGNNRIGGFLGAGRRRER